MQKNREKVRMYNAIYIFIIILIAFVCFLTSWLANPDAEHEFEVVPAEENVIEPSKILVHITGEVLNPGVYEIEQGTRVEQAIEVAGGATENADLQSVNLAKLLKDGDQVKVSAVKKSSGGSSKSTTGSTSAKKTGKVNINCGMFSEYMRINGMTETLANSIIEHIEMFGLFESIEELQFVEGMTPELYKKFESQFII